MSAPTDLARSTQDRTIVADRAFARTASDGSIDGGGDRGVYADDVRILRRVEAYRAEPEIAVPGEVSIGLTGAVARFQLDNIEPGAGVLIVVEVDGTDLFSVREHLNGEEVTSPLGLGDVRGRDRVRLQAWCHGDAQLEYIDGVALTDAPVPLDGTARTASWRWRVPTDSPTPANLRLELRASWSNPHDEHPPEPLSFEQLEEARLRPRNSWLAERPVVDSHDELGPVIGRSLEDLATLRIDTADGRVLAAGVPWFLTVFGRDSLLSAWMALPVDPDLAAATARHLARLQSTSYDLSVDAEPGKILHEERRGLAAERWHKQYYGSIDSTPLFVMMIEETCRWTADPTLALELRSSLLAAIRWIESRLEEDELGLLGYWRRSERGLDVQSWKDSSDSQADRTGNVASGLVRPLEAQAYAVAALRAAARLGRDVWNDANAADGWDVLADQLAARMQDRFFVELHASQLEGDDDPRASGFLAQAVDSSGLAVDSLCSNIGHVLWADALGDSQAAQMAVRQLSSAALWSGWGVRTMSTLDASYEADSYHRGSVWPHDTALCVAGIARHDREVAGQLALGLFEAAIAHDGQLPEAFRGDARDPSRPDAPRLLDLACAPQAWAAASPFLLLRTVLGLEVRGSGADAELVSTVEQAPAWVRGLRWQGIYATGGRWNVHVDDDGGVQVTAS